MSPLLLNLPDLNHVAIQVGYVCGAVGLLLKTDNYGNTWRQLVIHVFANQSMKLIFMLAV
jgi:photosystem II stability/assembly factor-like uncharacterized protein